MKASGFAIVRKSILLLKRWGQGGDGLFLHAWGWGIDHQERKNLQIPGGIPEGMVTGQF